MIVKSGPVTRPSTVIFIGMEWLIQPKPTWTSVEHSRWMVYVPSHVRIVAIIWYEGCCLTDRDSELEARRSGGVDLKPFEYGADGWGRGCGWTEGDGRVHVAGETV